MTALLTEVQTTDKMVKIAREQVDAFNNGDWERVRAGLASDSRLDELGTERKIEVGEDRRALQGLEAGIPRCRRHGDKLCTPAVTRQSWK